MRQLLAVLLAASLLGGCASYTTRFSPATPAPSAAAKRPGAPGTPAAPKKAGSTSPNFMERYSGSKKLEQAVDKLDSGDLAGAAKALNAICNGRSVPGVTDEALFRLALLTLKPGVEKAASGQGAQLLKRLRKEYPGSPWTAQAAPLVDLLNLVDELRQQNRNLKAGNQSLGKEINELNRTINQLKTLDLELEQKTR